MKESGLGYYGLKKRRIYPSAYRDHHSHLMRSEERDYPREKNRDGLGWAEIPKNASLGSGILTSSLVFWDGTSKGHRREGIKEIFPQKENLGIFSLSESLKQGVGAFPVWRSIQREKGAWEELINPG